MQSVNPFPYIVIVYIFPHNKIYADAKTITVSKYLLVYSTVKVLIIALFIFSLWLTDSMRSFVMVRVIPKYHFKSQQGLLFILMSSITFRHSWKSCHVKILHSRCTALFTKLVNRLHLAEHDIVPKRPTNTVMNDPLMSVICRYVFFIFKRCIGIYVYMLAYMYIHVSGYFAPVRCFQVL